MHKKISSKEERFSECNFDTFGRARDRKWTVYLLHVITFITARNQENLWVL